MEPVEIILSRGEEGEWEWWVGWIQARYIVHIYGNVTMKPHVELTYANKYV
jgi:hypothetical protein